MSVQKIEFARLFHTSKEKSIKSISKCYHPSCDENSINSHILQANGILSTIAPKRHLWQPEINQFKESILHIKRRGINEAFSFACFCKHHDEDLFKPIEKNVIDFNDYRSNLLFTIRTIYNEIYRKEVNVKMYKYFLDQKLVPLNKQAISLTIQQENLGIDDLQKIAKKIWNDLDTSDQSFVFKMRPVEKVDVCLSSFYNYDTSKEMNQYILERGMDMPRISHIFVNLFPYDGRSILMMGYDKEDESKVKGYFNTFFSESEKRLYRRLTNLILFQCETWVASDEFYSKYIKGNELLFAEAIKLSVRNQNERRNHDVSFLDFNFKDKLLKVLNN